MVLQRVVSWFRSGRRRRRPDVGHTGKKGIRLRLEALEDRNMPSVAANQAFVASLYHGLLGRTADSAGLASWTAQLNAGTSRQQVVSGIESSPEFVSREVQLLYYTLLGRTVDQAGLNFWGQQLANGTSLQRVEAGILGSDEFFIRAGSNMSSWLSALYRVELGRAVDPSGQATFANTPNTVEGRTSTATQVATSPEAFGDQVNGLFQEILGRPADAAALAFWTNQLASGTMSSAVAGIAGSTEYFTDLQTFLATSTATDANSAASQFIAARGLYSGTRPGVPELAGVLATNPGLVVQSLTSTSGTTGTGVTGTTTSVNANAVPQDSLADTGTAGSAAFTGVLFYPSSVAAATYSGALGSATSLYGPLDGTFGSSTLAPLPPAGGRTLSGSIYSPDA